MNLMKSGLTSGQTIAKIAAHAGAGGTLNVLQGGKFGHGFVSAGFTEALSPAVGQLGDGKDFGTILARTAASAAIGGTASKLSGGSFANGAKTGAFQQLFNELAHGRPPVDSSLEGEPGYQADYVEPSMFSSGMEGANSCTERCFNSASNGTVTHLGWQNGANHAEGFGYYLQIKDAEGNYFTYGHLDPASVTLRNGAVVVQSQGLGSYASPTNGQSSGPHLHFEYRGGTGRSASVLDPIPFYGIVMPNYRLIRGVLITPVHKGADLVQRGN